MTEQPTTDPGRPMRVFAFQSGTSVLGGFQQRGEAARRALGIDGTAGDAQDVSHPFERDDATDACVVCGLSAFYSKHEEPTA